MRALANVGVIGALTIAALAASAHAADPRLSSALLKLWTNARVQAAATTPTSSPALAWAQSVLANPPTAQSTPADDGDAAAAMVRTHLDLTSTPALAALDRAIKAACGAVLVQRISIVRGYAAYDSALLQCTPDAGGWGVWWQGVGGMAREAPDTPTMEVVWAFDGSRWTLPSTDSTMDALALATVRAVANAAGIPLYVQLNGPIMQANNSTAGFAAAMAAFDAGVTTMVHAFHEIASIFSTKTTNKIIGEQSCLGFNKFADNTSVNVIQCLPDEHATEFVDNYFSDIAWAFGGDQKKVTGELLVWRYAHASNWSSDQLQLTNTGASTVRMLKVFKNHDDEARCSHWVIADYSGVFSLAPDVILWERTKESWMGFKSEQEVYIQRVPHTLSPSDVESIALLYQIISFGQMAQTRGLEYTWPELTKCKGNVPSLRGGAQPAGNAAADAGADDVAWNWMATEWGACTAPCGGGSETRTVMCVSSDGRTDPTGAACNAAQKPATSQTCNTIPCTATDLLSTLKNYTDHLLTDLPGTTPGGSSALVSGLAGTGAHDVVAVPPDQVDTVQRSWQVANGWPEAVSKQFAAMIAAESQQYQAFTFSYNADNAHWTAVIGAARRFNGAVDMAYVAATGTGTPIQQHYGNDKSITCPAQTVTTYTPLMCRTPNSNCGNGKACPGSFSDYCPMACPCTPCQCEPIYGTENAVPSRFDLKVTCAQLLGGSALTRKVAAKFQPGRCQGETSLPICNAQNPYTEQTLNFAGCRNPTTLAACDKPLNADQVSVIRGALEVAARPQLPAHMNLLAVQLSLPPPYK